MKKDLNIFIACHKECNLPKDEGYVSLHVGAEGKKDLGFIKDSTGDNISLKNPNFCELTGIYWMWKNTKSKYIGLSHYRRYFFKKGNYHTLDKVLKKDDAIEILKTYDVIVPKKVKIFGKNIRKQYEICHHIDDFDTCRNIISEIYPEYLDAFDKISKRNFFYPYNMFVMSKDNFDKYCEWLFNILFEVEKRVDITNYSNYDKRIFGFLSERLFNVWLEKNNFKLKELSVYNTDDSYFKQRITNIIKNIIVH